MKKHPKSSMNFMIRLQKNKKNSIIETKKRRVGKLFALPILLGFLIFYLYPFLVILRKSFTLGGGGKFFVGLENYKELLENSLFRLATGNTLRYIAIGVPLLLLFSLFLALLLYRATYGSKIIRLFFVFPMVVPVSAIVVIVQGILSNTSPDMIHLILLFLWKNVGYNMILLFAGLAMIPRNYYENAQIDGASGMQCFCHITLPMLLPMLFLTFLVSMIDIFKSFREVLLLGGETPKDEIYMIQNFVNSSFENLNFQQLCVAMMFICIIVFSMIGVVYAIYHAVQKKYN